MWKKDNDGRDEGHHVNKKDDAKTCDAQTDNVIEDNNNASITVEAHKPHAPMGSISSDGDDDSADESGE